MVALTLLLRQCTVNKLADQEAACTNQSTNSRTRWAAYASSSDCTSTHRTSVPTSILCIFATSTSICHFFSHKLPTHCGHTNSKTCGCSGTTHETSGCSFACGLHSDEFHSGDTRLCSNGASGGTCCLPDRFTCCTAIQDSIANNSVVELAPAIDALWH